MLLGCSTKQTNKNSYWSGGQTVTMYFFKWYGILEADKCLQIEENKENGSKV